MKGILAHGRNTKICAIDELPEGVLADIICLPRFNYRCWGCVACPVSF